MPLDPVVASSASDGRWKIAFVPIAGNALSVAILSGGTSKALTYGYTATGFNYGITQTEVTDARLTLVQSLTRPGKTNETLETQFVASDDANSPAVVHPAGTEGKLVIRRGIANDVAWTVGQKVDVITFQAGVQRPDAPTENGLDTVTQSMFITAPTVRQGVLVA